MNLVTEFRFIKELDTKMFSDTAESCCDIQCTSIKECKRKINSYLFVAIITLYLHTGFELTYICGDEDGGFETLGTAHTMSLSHLRSF